ncbi:MAG: two-component sensor histidine kinase [Ruminococcus sp.]|nr:two-component sensor histidine kinase [Ruminococcus sp.]
MRIKIQRSMLVMLTITLLISYVVFSVVTYKQNLNLLKSEVRQEAEYISTAIEIAGTQFLEQMDEVETNTRVTLIDKDGTVLYDSRQDETSLENHSDRQEIIDALNHGIGENIRMSDTVRQELYYYAILLDDGTVLRVSKTMDGLVNLALQMMPVMTGLAAVLLIFSYVIAVRQTERLIQPINELDIENPLENDVYEELTPLLTAMDRQNKEKEAISNMRKEFSANVSHELKTPLTSISGYAEIMKNGLVRPQDMQNFAERIYKEARRLISLVEDIIKISKLDEEAVELEKEEVDIYQLCRESVSRLSPQAHHKNVTMSMAGERIYYTGIRQILDEMIYNICENAIKYNKDGGRVDVWVGDTLEGPIVRVKDTGIGIPEEHLERIFERFYRVDKSHSKETGGTGLGLSIVKHGAILHGASVNVESKLGEGTTITIKLQK